MSDLVEIPEYYNEAFARYLAEQLKELFPVSEDVE